MQNPIMALMGGGSGNKLLNGLMQTAMTTLKGQSPQMVLSFLASQPGFNDWFEANKDKTVGELVGQISK
jgi:hypothetical protein|nr:MAG TPA: hypothetical protein [Caudoviricetes sp.]DAT45032.1 MAG TPA: hypothetical protein [Caudoviricetes sp.]